MSSGRRVIRFTFTAILAIAACDREPADFEVVATFPHDPSAYTQGLVTSDSVLFESTGQYQRSEIRRVELRTGAVLARRRLHPDQFGEGLALHAGRLFQVTWRENVAYAYETDTFVRTDSFTFAGEGWGLASDGAQLFLSDGSDSIRVLDPESFRTERVLKVRYRDSPLLQLNELEFFESRLLANIFESSWIAVINPTTGVVERMLDFADLYPERPANAEVMNGIAVSPDGRYLLLTGKLWPKLFQVRILPVRP